MVLTDTGLAKVFQRIKSFVIAQLNSKASAVHTHTSSDITDLPNGYVVDSTLDGTSSNAIANSAVSSALDGKIPKAGGAVLNGQLYARNIDNSKLEICGATTTNNGAYIAVHGKNYGDTSYAGTVYILTNDGSNICNMLLKPDGTATWGNKAIDTIEEQGNGYIRYSNGLQICFKRSSIEANTTAPFTLPKSFIDTNYISEITNHTPNGPQCCIASYNSITKTGFDIRNIGPSPYFIDVISIGRWK